MFLFHSIKLFFLSYMKKLNFTEENMEKATFCKTKAGKGFKIAVNGEWVYASKESLFNVLNDDKQSCVFRKIKQEE